MTKKILALAATVLLAAGCGKDGKDGAAGAQGPAGQDGTSGADGKNGSDALAATKPEACEGCHPAAGGVHQAVYDSAFGAAHTDALVATINSVVSTLNTDGTTYTSTLTVTITKDGTPITDDPATLTGVFSADGQKTAYAGQYVDATTKFATAKNFSFSGWAKTGTAGQYTAKNAKAPFAPETQTATNAFVFAYFTDGRDKLPQSPSGYALYKSVASVAKVYGTIPYASTANVSGCEKCHPTPYRKHGYREAVVSGLPDFVACKACHTDQKTGNDQAWQVLADDPASLAAQGGTVTADQKTKYAYTAKLMNDVHMSHAMEFPYPQSMANCATCHDGHLTGAGGVLDNANFKLSTCKSCHPVTGPATPEAGRAPALKTLTGTGPAAAYHGFIDWYSTDPAKDTMCQTCHGNVGVSTAPLFSALHTGLNAQIYKADGTKYASVITSKIDSASFDKTANKLTVNFSVSGTATNALVKPTVVASLYGYNTKDFVVSGHSSQFSDKTPNLEWTEGAVIRGTTTPANNSRLTVTPSAAAANNTTWQAVIDLSTWASKLADGSVTRVQVNFLPALGLDQTQAVSSTNPAIAAAGVTKMITLSNAAIADAYAIVDQAKCNKCHDALGTTFHSPNYGSAGVAACRVCHTVNDGASHLEMQGRSIDSFVHAIHSFQMMDIGSIDFSDPVASMYYTDHIESNYPNFLIQNCESCHNPGTYDVPNQSKSLPGILSASATIKGTTRNIGGVPSYVTGPAVRACGSCHRAQLINEDSADGLKALNAHFSSFGTQVTNGTGVLDSVTKALMAIFK